jgi:ferredoxin
MSYEINDACVSCGDCVDECRIAAISQGETQYAIDQGVCVECGACKYVCDVGAISNEINHDE